MMDVAHLTLNSVSERVRVNAPPGDSLPSAVTNGAQMLGWSCSHCRGLLLG